MIWGHGIPSKGPTFGGNASSHDASRKTWAGAGRTAIVTVAPVGPTFPPTVISLNIASGSTAGGTAIVITGTNFFNVQSVTIGGNPATSVVTVNSTTINCTTPAGSAGAADVSVMTPAGTGTGTGLFTYVASAGWTVFTPSIDTTIIYVANNGSDSNSGLSVGTPVQTLSKGFSLLTDGKPDWLLFRKGDDFGNQGFDNFAKSGRSKTEPMIIGSYDASQPGVVDPIVGKSRPKFSPVNVNFLTNVGASGKADNLCLVGLELNGANLITSEVSWLFITKPLTSLLVEDCFIHNFNGGSIDYAAFSTPAGGVRIRRNVLTDGLNNLLFMRGVTSAILFQNIWDQNASSGSSTLRNVYIQSNENASTATGDIYIRSKSEGAQFRSGVFADGCLFSDNLGDSVELGHKAGDDDNANPFTQTTMKNCVLTNCHADISLSIEQGQGSFSGIVINNNVFDNSGVAFSAVALDPFFILPTQSNGLIITGNVIKNINGGIPNAAFAFVHGHAQDPGDYPSPNNSTITPNTISAAGTLTRTLAAYAGSIGLTASNAAFYTACRGQSKETWRDDLTGTAATTYILAGEGLTPI